MGSNKHRVSRATEATPQSREEAETLLGKIGAHQRRLDSAKANRDDEIEETRRLYAQRMEPLEEWIARDIEALQRYCEANRLELTNKGKRKSCTFATGKIGWRKNPPSIKIPKAKAVLDHLLGLKNKRFLRRVYAIDKEAMLAKPEAAAQIPGVAYDEGGELFYAAPNKTEDKSETAAPAAGEAA